MTRIILLEGKEVGPVPKRFGHCDAEWRNSTLEFHQTKYQKPYAIGQLTTKNLIR